MEKTFESNIQPHYHLLSDAHILEIHRLTLELMQNVGVRVQHDAGAKMLEAAGCRMDEHNMVRFPPELVEECLSGVPSSIQIYNRRGEKAMRLAGRNSYYGLGTDLIYTTDLTTGAVRKSLLQDVVNASRVADYCADIDFTASFALPDDVPANSMYLHCFKAMVENTIKPIFSPLPGKRICPIFSTWRRSWLAVRRRCARNLF